MATKAANVRSVTLDADTVELIGNLRCARPSAGRRPRRHLEGGATERMPLTDAFVDESVRGRRYLMACVMVEARHLSEKRQAIRDLALHRRVHFNNESTARRARRAPGGHPGWRSPIDVRGGL